jgi:hypothetical protein
MEEFIGDEISEGDLVVDCLLGDIIFRYFKDEETISPSEVVLSEDIFWLHSIHCNYF